jgi:hypothetical protein
MLSAPRPKNASREHSNFQSRTASDVAGELTKRWSILGQEGPDAPSPDDNNSRHASAGSANPYEPATNDSIPPPRSYSFTKRVFGWFLTSEENEQHANGASDPGGVAQRGPSQNGHMVPDPTTIQAHNRAENKKANGDPSVPRPGMGPRPVGGTDKLGMFSGVYVPTCLNVLSILMFLRFGFLLGRFFPAACVSDALSMNLSMSLSSLPMVYRNVVRLSGPDSLNNCL